MANLIGYVQGDRGRASRLAGRKIVGRLETWQGSIETTLDADGHFTVAVGPKEGPPDDHRRGQRPREAAMPRYELKTVALTDADTYQAAFEAGHPATPGVPTRTVEWEGADGEDAARRYVDCHRDRAVIACHPVRHGLFIGLPRGAWG
jgi:hypothetical protein